jgi:ADP-heptose:LPS heptosyltransferase
MLMLAARAPYRIGVGGGNNNLIYNVRVKQYDRSVPYVEGSKELSLPFGVDPDLVDWQPEIFLSAKEHERAESLWMKAAEMAGAHVLAKGLLVNLSASEAKRRWPDTKFVEVLQRIRRITPELPIVVIGLPGEWLRVSHVAKMVGALAAQTPQLRDALALVGTSDMVFTPDTSISHAASAFRKPAVVLLKREHYPYAPYNIPGENIFWDGDQIASLPVEEVGDAVERLVRQYSKTR